MVASVWFSFWIETFSLASTPDAGHRTSAVRHQAPGELVDDDELALLHHVVRVAQKQVVRRNARTGGASG